MKHALRTLSLLALMAHAVPLAALAPADIARLEQEVRAAITAGDYLIAQDLIARLEGAGARATAQPLMVQLSKALEKRAIGAAELERQYRNLDAWELKPLRRLRQELEARVKQLESDLTRARDFGYQQRDKVDALQRQLNSLEKKADDTSRALTAERNQREEIETAYLDLQKRASSQEMKYKKLEEQVRLKQDDLNQLTANFSDLENKFNVLTKERDGLKNRNAELQANQLKAAEEKNKLNERVKALVEENNALTNNVNTYQRLSQDLQNKVESIKRNITEQTVGDFIKLYNSQPSDDRRADQLSYFVSNIFN